MSWENIVATLIKDYPSILFILLGIVIIILDQVKSIKAIQIEAEMADDNQKDHRLFKMGLILIIMGSVISILAYAKDNYPEAITLNGEIIYDDGTPARFAYLKIDGKLPVEVDRFGKFTISNVSRNVGFIYYKLKNLDFIPEQIYISHLDIYKKYIPIKIVRTAYTIKGTINDEYNEPLYNAVVSIGNNTDTTDEDGSYSIDNICYDLKTDTLCKISVLYDNKLRYQKNSKILPKEYKEDTLVRNISLSSLSRTDICGIVSNVNDNEPVVNATVEIDMINDTTDNNGHFLIKDISRNTTRWKVITTNTTKEGDLYCDLDAVPHRYDRICVNDIKLNI